ncbi:Radical SAM superfamily enzyme, MoaA/NifB/PqqE/SkfB family [Paraburkholderia steynii]|uniref:Radical SAM superfamily enzyme, MoaA/NifB/PqqE/SkfB family n=1 Tax=Paraburkholderia steynii TaxID=1245441 RepID=A0A7Z7FGN3_9BURK|nr:radical SAM protein [Paraburkholderia steynii]SDH72305.1 Radical SAM superfamily enzyme, MoaA/NifB/PqqE/SkfB family [Paraburkholderia steynii]
MSENKPKEGINRFGQKTITMIPVEAPLNPNPGHKLRTSNVIVNRQALSSGETLIDSSRLDKVAGQKIEFYSEGNQVGVIRVADQEEGGPVPNQFTGPSYRNPRQRFRFDGHKMMHHLDRLLAWERGERFAPVHIDMGLTKFCNTACLYCYAVVQNMTRGTLIEREALLSYIEDCGRLGVRSIGFIGDGEPTLNPALYDATVRAGELGVDTSMATNGLLLDMDRAHDLLKNMSWIRFNLSAGTREGFRRVHQSKEENFDLLIEKIRALVQIKKQYGYKCTLGLQMVLIPECFDEVLPEARLGAELGVDYFVIKHCSDSEYKEIGINYEDYLTIGDVLKEAESYSTADYVVQAKWNKINAASESALYKNGIRKYDVCHGTPFLLQISGNGKVYPCGPFFNKERFYIGDLHEQSFFDMVMGDRYWAVHRDVTESVDVHKDCAIGCRQDYVNKFLWDLKNPPEHVNFI